MLCLVDHRLDRMYLSLSRKIFTWLFGDRYMTLITKGCASKHGSEAGHEEVSMRRHYVNEQFSVMSCYVEYCTALWMQRATPPC